MVRELSEGGFLPPITIAQNEDGEYQLEDGHHRLAAYWLSGRISLDKHEYILVQKRQWRAKHDKIEILVEHM